MTIGYGGAAKLSRYEIDVSSNAGLRETCEKEYSEKNSTDMFQWAIDELTRFQNGKFSPFWTTKLQIFEEILGLELKIQ